MNWLSLRNNRLKFKTSANLPIILEDFVEYTSKLVKKKPNDVTSLEEIVSKSTLLATRPLWLAPKKCINKSIWLATGGAPSGCQPNWFVYAFSWVRSPQRRVDLDTISSSACNQLDLETLGYWPIMPKNIPDIDTALNTSPAICFCINNQDLTFMIINRIRMVNWGSKVGTCYLVEAHETQVRWCCSLLFNIRQFDLHRHLI
jgi:hypothetical protein